jgi:LmbE family N-acetylglucosaminyl deacetylase
MRLLVVVAHPDDETYGCGSLLAYALAAGAETAVLCATRGEAGESRIATDDLAAVREAELRAAAEVLGVSEVRLLDHVDSGMSGDPLPGSLCAVDPAVVAGEVGAALADLRPDVVVTLDAADGHRDHAVIRDATLRAVDSAAHPPAATYLRCVTRSTMETWLAHMRETGGFDPYFELGELGTPDDQITCVLETTEHLDRRWEAIRAHASQHSPYEDLPAELQDRFLTRDPLMLVRGTDTLFA